MASKLFIVLLSTTCSDDGFPIVGVYVGVFCPTLSCGARHEEGHAVQERRKSLLRLNLRARLGMIWNST